MSRVVIDARESGTSTGRYVDKLVEHLHALHPQHDITLLAKKHRVPALQQLAPSFTVAECSVKEFTRACCFKKTDRATTSRPRAFSDGAAASILCGQNGHNDARPHDCAFL